MAEDLELKDLGHFTGSDNFYKLYNTTITDGIKYIMENGYSWFVTDSLVMIKSLKVCKSMEFIAVKLVLDNTTMGAEMRIEDGNGKIAYKQKYKFTDAKKNIIIYYENGTLSLPMER